MEEEVPNIKMVPTVNEFEDVFSEELPRLPPEKEVKFCINLIPGTEPISKIPYQMAPVEI